MELPGFQLLLLLLAGAGVAGWIDAVIGGGGLVLIPLLLIAFPGVHPAVALGTNKLTAIWGTGTAAIFYLRSNKVSKKLLVVSIPIAGGCAAVGALTASFVNSEVLRPVVIVLMLLVGIFVMVMPNFGKKSSGNATVRPVKLLLSGISFAVPWC
ncbi:MAG: TSUP family transporter [Mycobacteriaceae bacterium]